MWGIIIIIYRDSTLTRRHPCSLYYVLGTSLLSLDRQTVETMDAWKTLECDYTARSSLPRITYPSRTLEFSNYSESGEPRCVSYPYLSLNARIDLRDQSIHKACALFVVAVSRPSHFDAISIEWASECTSLPHCSGKRSLSRLERPALNIVLYCLIAVFCGEVLIPFAGHVCLAFCTPAACYATHCSLYLELIEKASICWKEANSAEVLASKLNRCFALDQLILSS